MRVRLLLWDLVAVGIFVVLGRDTHQESQGLREILATAAPFIGALAVGWLAANRRDPVTTRGGAVVVPITIVGGVLLRRFGAGEGIALPFVIVTALFLTATMLGWRLAVRGLDGRRRRLLPAGAGNGHDRRPD